MLSSALYDLRYYIKNLAEAIYIYIFFVSLIAIFVFASPAGVADKLGGMALWISLILSMLLSAPHMFQRDQEQGLFDYWRLLPIAMEWMVLARFIACYLILVLPLVALVPAAGMLLNIPQNLWGEIALLIAVGSVPVLALIVMSGAMMAGLSQHAGLIGLIILPLAIPVIIFGISATNQLIETGTTDSMPMTLLVGLSGMLLPLSVVVAASCLRSPE